MFNIGIISYGIISDLNKPTIIRRDVDESIDGDNATVTVQIEVYDYFKVNNEVNNYIGNNPNDFSTEF